MFSHQFPSINIRDDDNEATQGELDMVVVVGGGGGSRGGQKLLGIGGRWG